MDMDNSVLIGRVGGGRRGYGVIKKGMEKYNKIKNKLINLKKLGNISKADFYLLKSRSGNTMSTFLVPDNK